MSMERWKDRVVLVTGASSGIGAAVALRLADEGMRVVAWARREERLRELTTKTTGRLSYRSVDLRDERSILEGFLALRTELGGVDAIVNNAGLGHLSSLMTGETAAWREMLDVNVLALCICTREALTDMRRRKIDDGHVIHVSSMAAHRVPNGSGVYSATKFAVRSLTEGLRKELREAKSGIRVSSVSPGFVETEFAAHYHGSEEAAEETYGRFKVLEPNDIANAVVYLLSQPAHVEVHDVLVRPVRQES